jgi:ubiquinone/menaquinone biosynthesis C-methylase UbiE
MQVAGLEYRRRQPRAIDIGCGAARNTVPLAAQGWLVTGTDLSLPMLAAAAERVRGASLAGRVQLALAPMEALPAPDAAFDLVIAHGIWNLARTGDQFRRAVAEGARVARDGAMLFVFTFSRRTIPAAATPAPGETFVFTEFSGEPQCFLTEAQLVDELARAGFERDAQAPLRELNVPPPGALAPVRAPVIWEGVFRRVR